MKQAGLKCKPSKREILRESIKYLGLLVDKHGIKLDPGAVEAVLTWKARKIDTQLIEFIKEYADKIYPKQQLMQKKGNKFIRREIEMVMKYDLIEPSKSPCACGIVMAKRGPF